MNLDNIMNNESTNLQYIGIQDGDDLFIPLYNDKKQGYTTLCPKNQETLDDLAKSNEILLVDCLENIKAGKKLTFSIETPLSTKESYESLMQAILSRIKSQAQKGLYSNPTSKDCQTFYKAFGQLEKNGINSEMFKDRYEEISGYRFKPALVKLYQKYDKIKAF